MTARKIGEVRSAAGELLVTCLAPAAGQDALSIGLRILTHQIGLTHPELMHGGGLGGAYGYGVRFENSVFMMHPYCGCEQSQCRWCAGCSCEADDTERRRWFVGDQEVSSDVWWTAVRDAIRDKRISGWEASDTVGRVVHGAGCIYADGGENEPNFRHKSSGMTATWYKWIGRENKVTGATDLLRMFEECLASIGAPSLEECLRLYATAEADASAASQRAMNLLAKVPFRLFETPE